MLTIKEYCKTNGYEEGAIYSAMTNKLIPEKYIVKYYHQGAKNAHAVYIDDKMISKDNQNLFEFKEFVYDLYYLFREYALGDSDIARNVAIKNGSPDKIKSLGVYLNNMFMQGSSGDYIIKISANMHLLLGQMLIWFDKIASIYERKIVKSNRISRRELLTRILDNRMKNET